MSNSALVNYTRISPNKNSPRNHAIDTISIHCVVGQLSVETIGNVFAPSSAGCSANYGIGADGRIGMYVEEKDRSWCTSSSANDNRAITIECASDTTSPYAVNDKVYNALINLLVDICQRNGIKSLKWQANKALIGQVDKQNMTVHRWFANKACPGDYIYECLGDIAAKVNAKLGVSSAPSTPAISESKVPYKVRITATDLRIRKGPGTNTAIVQKAIAPGVYTIVSEATGEGATKWGKLKSGVGWVSLDFCKKL